MEHTQKISPKQLAERWSVSVKKVLAWIQTGQLAAINVAVNKGGSPRYRIDEKDIAEFERLRVSAPTAAGMSIKPKRRCHVPAEIRRLQII